MNILKSAVAAIAPQLATKFVAYVEANRKSIDTRLNAASGSAVTYIETAIFAALPAKGVSATLFEPEIKAVVNQLAKDAITAAGGEVTALISLAELEITELVAKLAAH
jgi:hypothetical protein